MQPCQVQFILLSKSWHSLTGDRPVHYQDLNPLSSTELQTPCVSPGEAVGQILHLPSALMKVQTVGKLTLVCESCPANATELALAFWLLAHPICFNVFHQLGLEVLNQLFDSLTLYWLTASPSHPSFYHQPEAKWSLSASHPQTWQQLDCSSCGTEKF